MPYVVITLIVAFTMHELAHAYVAYRFGDDTAAKPALPPAAVF
jgi:Zn-dependent protease